MSTATGFTYLQDIINWIKNPGVYMYGRWDNPPSAMEGGVDIGSPGGTPVYALATGVLEGAGNFWHSANLYTPGSGNPGYGVLTERVNIPGYGMNDLYYQHIQLSPNIQTCYAGNCNGQVVYKGEQIGTIIPGVNMLEMGLNADWGGVWGTNHPNAWATDPRPEIAALINNYDSSGSSVVPTQTTGTTGATSGVTSIWSFIQGLFAGGVGSSSVPPNLPSTPSLPSLQDFGISSIFVVIGLVLILIGFWTVFRGNS
jgi:hypothetical protein